MDADEFGERAERLVEETSEGVSHKKLFTDQFIASRTDFDTLQAMLDHGGFETFKDFFENIPDDSFFVDNTQFGSFTGMKAAAGSAFVKSIMGGDESSE